MCGTNFEIFHKCIPGSLRKYFEPSHKILQLYFLYPVSVNGNIISPNVSLFQ